MPLYKDKESSALQKSMLIVPSQEWYLARQVPWTQRGKYRCSKEHQVLNAVGEHTAKSFPYHFELKCYLVELSRCSG